MYFQLHGDVNVPNGYITPNASDASSALWPSHIQGYHLYKVLLDRKRRSDLVALVNETAPSVLQANESIPLFVDAVRARVNNKLFSVQTIVVVPPVRSCCSAGRCYCSASRI